MSTIPKTLVKVILAGRNQTERDMSSVSKAPTLHDTHSFESSDHSPTITKRLSTSPDPDSF